MKRIVRFVCWAVLFGALAGLFYLQGGGAPAGRIDSQTTLTLYTPAGPQTVTMAAYLPLAVAAEMPASFGAEALKAQAVAARTYVLACRRHGDAAVCTDSGCCIAWLDEQALRERWGGNFGKNMRAVRLAAAATDGEYLAYDGAPIQAAFHASSLGCTEDSGALWSPLPYLVSVTTPESPDDTPGLVTTAAFSAASLARALRLIPAQDSSGWLERIETDGAGRVSQAAFCGRTFTGAQVRSALGLRSTAFTVAWAGDVFTFTVAGYGHGVGMSQAGARVYAAQGMSYRDILAHYYPGTALARLSPDPAPR